MSTSPSFTQSDNVRPRDAPFRSAPDTHTRSRFANLRRPPGDVERGVRRRRLTRPVGLLTLVAIGALLLAACGDSDDDGDTTPAVSAADVQAEVDEQAEAVAQAQAAPVDDAPSEFVNASGLVDGVAEFDFGTAVSNAYWYSRYTLGSLSMMSGLGLTFAPPMEAVMGMVAAVDQGPEDGEHVTLPGGPALLRAVYASGEPAFTAEFNGDPNDLANFRWDAATFDETITSSAQAQIIIKELEWAKFFNSPGWAGPVTNDFGAQDRFKGMVMYALAKNQIAFALEHMRNADGLFVTAVQPDGDGVRVSDDAVSPAVQYQMLQALSDMRWLLQHTGEFNDVYADPEFLNVVSGAADALFDSARAMPVASVFDAGLGAQAAAWYAASSEDAARQDEALAWLEEIGESLLDAQADGPIDQARVTRGLFEVARVLDVGRFQDGAQRSLDGLLSAYRPETGHFDGITVIRDWEVGDILGALNSALVNGDSSLDRVAVQNAYAGFFESIINRGGLLQAVIPKELEASPFELDRFPDDLAFGYPGIPGMGEAGRAAVHASELRFDAEAGLWVVTDASFDTAGAMHTSNEMFWTFGLVDGFPSVDRVLVANVLP